MFHDTKLHHTNMIAMAFELNAQAFRLMAFVQWYSDRGEKTLPVQYLRRAYFTRRQWELATKGTREYEGRKLADPDSLGKDGLQSTGAISEHREYDPETKRTRTYWVIGAVNDEVLNELRERREDAGFDVIEDPKPTPENTEVPDKEETDRTSTTDEKEYAKGYRHGVAHGYGEGFKDGEIAGKAGCVKDAPLTDSFKDTAKRHAGNFLFSKQEMIGFMRAHRRMIEAETAPKEPENPNLSNLSALLAGQRGACK